MIAFFFTFKGFLSCAVFITILDNSLAQVGFMEIEKGLTMDNLVFSKMLLTEDLPVIIINQMGGVSESTPIILPIGTWVKLIQHPNGNCYIQTEEGEQKNEFIRFPL